MSKPKPIRRLFFRCLAALFFLLLLPALAGGAEPVEKDTDNDGVFDATIRFAGGQPALQEKNTEFGEEWEKGDEVLRDLLKYETTLVLYMTLSSLDRTAAVFKKHYPPDLPVAVVYNAGFAEKEKVLKSDLDHIVEDVKSVDEKWLGLVIVGKCAE